MRGVSFHPVATARSFCLSAASRARAGACLARSALEEAYPRILNPMERARKPRCFPVTRSLEREQETAAAMVTGRSFSRRLPPHEAFGQKGVRSKVVVKDTGTTATGLPQRLLDGFLAVASRAGFQLTAGVSSGQRLAAGTGTGCCSYSSAGA